MQYTEDTYQNAKPLSKEMPSLAAAKGPSMVFACVGIGSFLRNGGMQSLAKSCATKIDE